MDIILASGSPRRKEILDQIGLKYRVVVSDADENTDAADPAHMVEELSIAKCQAVQARLEADNIGAHCVIGADTVVACDGEILGKPIDEADAKKMLKGLSGRKHQVFTGVTILLYDKDNSQTLVTFHEETDVYMAALTDAEIDRYIATGEPLDKAGAYGIQGKAAAFVEKIDGDYYNVVGLPIARLYKELIAMGLDIEMGNTNV